MSNKRVHPRNKKVSEIAYKHWRTNNKQRVHQQALYTQHKSEKLNTFTDFKNTQNTNSKVTSRTVFLYRVPVTILNCYSELAYGYNWIKKRKKKKIENRDFFITFGSGPAQCCSLLSELSPAVHFSGQSFEEGN